MADRIRRVCDECGVCTSDGMPGEAGTEHAHLWFCHNCWLAWDLADGRIPRAQGSIPPDIPDVARQPDPESEFGVSYELPHELPDVALLQAAAQRMVAIPDTVAREEAVQTVFKLLDAILASPEDLRKRKVKKSNPTFHKKVGRHSFALDFLYVAGFVDGDDPEAEAAQHGSGKGALLIMNVAFIMRLTDAHHILASVATKAGMTAPSLPQSQGSSGIFNPSQSSQQTTGVPLMKKAPVDGKSDADKLREELRKKERAMQENAFSKPVPMRQMAFWLSAGRRLEEVIRETVRSSEETSPREHSAHRELPQGQARSAEVSRSQVHGLCILRVVCPDKSVLQVQFRAGDRGEYVVEQLAPLLAPHVQATNWYIYQSPPLRRLAPKETLAAAGLAPGASMYLGFDGERPGPPFLEASLVAQLGSPPQEDPCGVSAQQVHTDTGAKPPATEARKGREAGNLYKLRSVYGSGRLGGGNVNLQGEE